MKKEITTSKVMPHRHIYTLCVILFVFVMLHPFLSGSVMAQNRSTETSISAAPAFSAKELTTQPANGWLTNGGNLYNQRYSPLNQINRDNVAGLKAVWRTRLGGSGMGPQYSGESQPIVYDGVIYTVTGADDVFAISVETGKILWQYQARLDQEISSVCCGWTSRGVALGDGKIYVGQLDGRLLALDQKTGKPAWSVQAARWQEGYSITSAPLYYAGMVITGFAGAEFGTRGRVSAYDADDGSPVWTFYTIPGKGEFGHDTWPQDNDVWENGGGSVWQTPAVDAELGLIYFATANPGPDFNGAVRAGDNLFTSAIVAIDAETGKYRWHFQQVHHDIWDYDSANPVVLFDVPYQGETRKAIAEVSKTGMIYILDRITGKPLIGIDEREVPQEARQATSATQPFPIGDPVVPQFIDIAPEGMRLTNQGRIFTPFYGSNGVAVKPGAMGGANWPPTSYDPGNYALYVCATESIGKYIGGDRDYDIAPEGERYWGGTFAFAPTPETGIFAAMDMRTNKIIWRQRWNDKCYSGSAVTAGGLLFVGRSDGRFTALNSDDGMILWQFQTGAGVNAPPSVFEYKGEQHVVVYSAGNLFAGSPRGDSVWLFSLTGTMGPVEPPDLSTPPLSVRDLSDQTEIKNINPRQLFAKACVPCHGIDGKGGHGGGAPLTNVLNLEFVIRTITEGRNEMPRYGSSLTAEEIRAVSTYVMQDLFP